MILWGECVLDVYLSDKAFLGLVLSAIETYKRECMGTLLGYNTCNRIVVEYAIPYQIAERKPSGVEVSLKRESRIKEILPKVCQLEHVGYFHSHTQWGQKMAETKLSEIDVRDMVPTKIEIVVAVNDSKKRITWNTSASGKELYGTIGRYYLKLACYYKTKDGKIRRCKILCPYILGFDLTFT